MNEFFPVTLVLLVGTALALAHATRFPQREGTWFLASFAIHVVAAFGQIWFTQRTYGVGDMMAYIYRGEMVAAVLRTDPGQFLPEVVKILFQQPGVIPADIVRGMGTSTASMEALSGLLMFFTGGSLYTLSLIVTVGAYFGQVALYAAFREAFPREFHRGFLFAALLIPSEVYWCSGLIKEGVAAAGTGLVVLGIGRLVRKVQLQPLVLVAIGGTIVALFKAYVLFTIAIGAAAWFYVLRAGPTRSRGIGIGRLILGAATVIVAMAALVKVFPQYDPETVAERAGFYQEFGQEISGASTYTMGSSDRTIEGQVVYAPLALVTSVFRPFVFEARSPQVFVNALETFLLLLLAVRVLWRLRFQHLWALMNRYPMLVFCAVFTVVFGVGVGLTTTNLGALSRYRAPLIPFVWGALLFLNEASMVIARERAAREAPVDWTARNRAALRERARAAGQPARS